MAGLPKPTWKKAVGTAMTITSALSGAATVGTSIPNAQASYEWLARGTPLPPESQSEKLPFVFLLGTIATGAYGVKFRREGDTEEAETSLATREAEPESGGAEVIQLRPASAPEIPPIIQLPPAASAG